MLQFFALGDRDLSFKLPSRPPKFPGRDFASGRTPPGPSATAVSPWRSVGSKLALVALLAAASVGLIFALSQTARILPADFTNYYAAGKIVRDGQGRRLYDSGLQRRVEGEVSGHKSTLFQPFLHPPFEALLFAALAGLSYPHAFVLWGCLNLLLAGSVVRLLQLERPCLDGVGHGVWLAVCLLFTLVTLALGQDAMGLAVAFLLAFLALKRRLDFVAGMALGLGLYRFQILLPFAFVFLLRRRWRLLGGFAVVGAAEILVSAATVGWSGLLTYANVLVRVGAADSGPWADSRLALNGMPTLHGALGALLAHTLPSRYVLILVLAATLVLLLWAAWALRSLDRPEDPAFNLGYCLAVIAALLAGYHAFASEMTPLIVVAFLGLRHEEARKPRAALWRRPCALLFLLFVGVFVARAVFQSPPFSVEIFPLLAVVAWLSWELSSLRKPAPAE